MTDFLLLISGKSSGGSIFFPMRFMIFMDGSMFTHVLGMVGSFVG